MTKVHIPDSIADAIKSLTGLAALLKAKEWERAAIVYAFTTDDVGRPPNARKVVQLPIRQFCEIGITGLKTQDTVRVYRRAWQSAIDDGQAQPVSPGDDIELPALPWPPTAHERGRIDKARASALPAEKAAIIHQLITEDPEAARIVADSVAEAIVKAGPEATAALARGVAEQSNLMALVEIERHESERDALPRGTRERDYSKDFRGAADRLLRCLEAMRSGTWEPNMLERTLARFMASAWTEASGEEPTYSVIDEIQAFLSTERKPV